MIRILFVDDQPEVLRGLRRGLETSHRGWTIEFSNNGEEALNLMSQSPFDVVVSDMRMEKMNGVELLDIIMERYPDTIRIILSGYSDKKLILSSLNCSHQFIAKPCSIETIRYTIERANRLRDLLRNGPVRKIVTGIKGLPSPPSLYEMIVREMQSPDASLKKVGHIISRDVSMSARILQIVNSAYFGLPQKIMDTQQAVTYLGMKTLKALILSIHVFSSFAKEAELFGFSLSEIRRHSFMVSKLAREIARVETVEKEVADQAFIAGMMHDIGKLILLRLPEQYRQVMELIETTGSDFVEAENYVMNTSHAELGAYFLGLWGFPDSIVEAVAFHHRPLKLVNSISIMENRSSDKDTEETQSNEGNTGSQTTKKSIMAFNILTAVHVANALMVQKDCTHDTTVFSYIDMGYLRTLNLTDRLPEWVECYNNIMREEVHSE